MDDQMSAPPVSGPVETPAAGASWKRFAAAVGSGVAAFVAVFALCAVIWDVWPSAVAFFVFFVPPLLAPFIVLARSRWWVRSLAALASWFVSIFLFGLLISWVFSQLEFAAVG